MFYRLRFLGGSRVKDGGYRGSECGIGFVDSVGRSFFFPALVWGDGSRVRWCEMMGESRDRASAFLDIYQRGSAGLCEFLEHQRQR